MMVCPYDDERLLLILQVDHSKVTGWFAAHWGNDTFAPSFSLRSDGLGRSGARYRLVGLGDQAAAQRRRIAAGLYRQHQTSGRQSLAGFLPSWDSRLAEQDPYAGYIVSLALGRAAHARTRACSPYMPDYTVYPEVKEFLSEQESYRAELMKQLKSLGRVSRLHFRRTTMDKLQTDGSLRSDGPVRLQSLSVQQRAAKKRSEPYDEQCTRADSTRQDDTILTFTI